MFFKKYHLQLLQFALAGAAAAPDLYRDYSETRDFSRLSGRRNAQKIT